MTTNTLYIYQMIKPDGKKRTTKSLTQRTDKGELIGTEYRLVADPGKVLTDGKQIVTVIDTTDLAQWQEIDEPESEPEPEVNNEQTT